MHITVQMYGNMPITPGIETHQPTKEMIREMLRDRHTSKEMLEGWWLECIHMYTIYLYLIIISQVSSSVINLISPGIHTLTGHLATSQCKWVPSTTLIPTRQIPVYYITLYTVEFPMYHSCSGTLPTSWTFPTLSACRFH